MAQTPEKGGKTERDIFVASREALKELKKGFDDGRLDVNEPMLKFFLSHELGSRFRRRKAELAHQLALRHERRGEFAKALSYYEMAQGFATSDEYLTNARILRDLAILHCQMGKCEEGLKLIREVLPLHERDLSSVRGNMLWRIKGERQRRVSEGYKWRVELLAGQEVDAALYSLYDLALYQSSDFDIRDQYYLVKFVLDHATADMKPRLEARLVRIRMKRRNIVRAAFLLGKLGVDTSLVITKHVTTASFRTIFRKE